MTTIQTSTMWMLNASLPTIHYKDDVCFDGWFKTVDEYRKYQRKFPVRSPQKAPAPAPVVVAPSTSPDVPKKTVLCSFGINCTRTVCTFAHNASEIAPRKCRFDARCSVGYTCTYIHSSESVHQYVDRLTKKTMKPKKEVSYNPAPVPVVSAWTSKPSIKVTAVPIIVPTPTPAPVVQAPVLSQKRVMCSLMVCKKGSNCTFAHTFEELFP